MKSHSCRSFEVFDFQEEAELVAGKFLSKFKNPTPLDGSTLNYETRECVSQGTYLGLKNTGSVPHVGIDLVDCDGSSEDVASNGIPRSAGGYFVTNRENSSAESVLLSNWTCHGEETQLEAFKSRDFDSEFMKMYLKTQDTSLGNDILNCSSSECPSNNEPVDAVSESNQGLNEACFSSSASEIAEDYVLMKSFTSTNSLEDMKLDNLNQEIVLHPDFIVYRDSYCTESLLTFSHSGIKINSFSSCGNLGFFNFEWAVDDLINIECQWFQSVDTVMIKLRVISKAAVQPDTGCDASGIDEIKVAVVDSNWSEKQEKITALNLKYMVVWGGLHDADRVTDGDYPFEQKHYFPNFDELFEEVVYPKGDSDAVTICKRDVDLLQPETFANDTIIDFYIKYLKNLIESEERHKFHFFNSFFFRKMADLDKDPSSASDGRAAFLRVRKWTRKLDLFNKDFIFIPINFNLHWSLIIICHPGEIVKHNDEDLKNSLRAPCILHMDSIKGSHGGLKSLIQRIYSIGSLRLGGLTNAFPCNFLVSLNLYLWEEWKERQMETAEDFSSKFSSLRFLPLELPQQKNLFDCGLFLLHYLELFLKEAPVNFNPFKISKFSKFLNVNWFPPNEASLKRVLIQTLIFELLENRSQSMSSLADRENHEPKLTRTNENKSGMEYLSERCSPTIKCNGTISASSRDNQHVSNSDSVGRDLFESVASSGSLLGRQLSVSQSLLYFHFDGDMKRIQEDGEEECAGHLQSEIGIESLSCDFPYSSQGYDANASDGLQDEYENIRSSTPETSACTSSSSDAEDIGIIEHFRADNIPSPGQKVRVSPAIDDIIESPQETDTFHDAVEPLPSSLSKENPVLLPKDDSKRVMENNEIEYGMDVESGEQEEHPAKKLRFTPSLEDEECDSQRY